MKTPTHLSTKGARFIARWEGMVLHPYNDPVGYATIGIGHLLHRSRVTLADKRRWRKFKATDAYALLLKDAERFAAPLAAHARKHGWKLTQPQFDALVSFSFNVGVGWLDDSTIERTLTGAYRNGHTPLPASVQRALAMWSKAAGRVLHGLVVRRYAEARLFNTGRYS